MCFCMLLEKNREKSEIKKSSSIGNITNDSKKLMNKILFYM